MIYDDYMVKIGIIGGTGLDNPKILENYSEKTAKNKYGKLASPLKIGKIKGIDTIILSRHGKEHNIMPTKINYLANIKALKDENVTHILATTAVGSLRKEIKPGNLVFPNQFIDFTKQRDLTFFYDKIVHTPMAEPFNKKLRDILCKSCDELKLNYNTDKTVITIEGPRFSTKAESLMFKSWGADIINMSTIPEAILANELKMPYQTIAMSTDYDCWKEDEESVTWELILERMKDNADNVIKLILKSIPKISDEIIKHR